jgi:protease-4
MIRILVQLVLSPLRMLYFMYCRLRLLRKPGSVLLHRVPDRFTVFRSSGLVSLFVPQEEVHFVEYMSHLRTIAESPHIRTVILSVPETSHSLVETGEIAAQILRIRSAGKRVLAHSEGGGLKTLLLLAQADERYAAPSSDFHSFLPASEPHFIRGLLARFGIRVHTRAAGKFKSAGEMFSRDGSSPAARENLAALVSGLRESVLQHFEGSPELKKTALRFSEQTLWSAQELRGLGFFSDLLSEDELVSRATGEVRQPASHPFQKDPAIVQTGKTVRLLEDEAVLIRRKHQQFRPVHFRKKRSLAYAAMEGTIVAGRRGDSIRPGLISACAYRDLFSDLAETGDEVIFLAINSPGGSPDGSEILYQSIRELGRQKPVIALLGGVAASGGYYAAAAAHKIFASPASITGSIGVVRLQPEASGLYKKLGIRSERIGFRGTEDILSFTAPPSKSSERLIQRQLETTYSQFLGRVASGRGMNASEVRKHAEGRVYTGLQFLKTGLIDGVMDFAGALDYYRAEAGIPGKPFVIHTYPEVRLDLRTMLTEQMPFSGALAALRGSTLLYSHLADQIARI